MSATATGAPPRSRPPFRLRYASFESRVAAGTLDVLVMLIIASLLVTLGSIVVLISSDFERVDPSNTAINIFWGCVGAIPPAFLLYFFVSLAWKGQTVGAAVMQLMIIRSDGRPLGPLGAIARLIGLLLYVLIIGAGVGLAFLWRENALQSGLAVAVAFLIAAFGFLWSAFDTRRRTLHDLIAGTIVVRIG
ncbi:MAG: RDD family protein [Dehalococcoidia bacterium]|nr:RDD family protein [Dehalococcoidia bacterium]